jgi:hydroxymethylpyrimidine pyrophosphatase-like HAD family hydrolase
MNILLIVDVDGTINTMGQKFDIARVPTVLPMENARETLEAFKQAGSTIVYLTGRMDEQLKDATDTWLRDHGFVDAGSVIYFQTRHGHWTWENYLRFKVDEARALSKQHPGFVTILVDDNSEVIARARKDGFSAALVRQPGDWIALQQKYLRSRVITQLDDFARSSSTL